MKQAIIALAILISVGISFNLKDNTLKDTSKPEIVEVQQEDEADITYEKVIDIIVRYMGNADEIDLENEDYIKEFGVDKEAILKLRVYTGEAYQTTTYCAILQIANKSDQKNIARSLQNRLKIIYQNKRKGDLYGDTMYNVIGHDDIIVAIMHENAKTAGEIIDTLRNM